MRFFYTIILIIMISLTSCLGPSQEEVCKQRPYTMSESRFFNRLQKSGYKVIDRSAPVPICETPRGSSYLLVIGDLPVSSLNEKDSLMKVGRSMASRLYESVIADSILYSTNQILIVFSAKNPNDSQEIMSIDYEYSIDSLSKWAGFKIIKTSENSFKRKPKE